MMATDNELMECIDINACRTCGIFYLTASNFLRQIFTADPEMVVIRMELAAWNVEIHENDGFPQHICIGCIHEFQKVFQFRRSCLDIQQQFKHFYNLREENKIKIKTEMPDENEEVIRDFIYVDDLSDNEYDGGAGVTPFNVPHVPIKEEIIEEATIPNETLAGAVSTAMEPSLQAEPEQAHEINLKQELNIRHELTESQEKIPAPENITKSQCNLCLYIASTQAELHEHMRRIHETNDLECHICGKKFKNSTSARLKFHLKWHKLKKHIKCAHCGFYCDSHYTLREHKKATHSKIKCEVCDNTIYSKKFKAHMRRHISKTDWECSYCKEVFKTETEREHHIWKVHANEDEEEKEKQQSSSSQSSEIICAECEQICSSREDLQQHLLEQHQISAICTEDNQANKNENSFLVESFNNSMSGSQSTINELYNGGEPHNSENNINNDDDDDHTQTVSNDVTGNINEDVTSNNIVNKFICAQCTDTFENIEQLCAHHQEHLKKASFECQICGKSFDLKFSLNRHLKKHQKVPF